MEAVPAPVRVLFVAAAALAVIGCGKREIPPKLTAFERDYFDALFEFRPSFAAYHGLHQWDGRLDAINPATVSRRIDELKHMHARLQGLRQQELPPLEVVDAEVFEHRIRAELMELEELENWRHDPIPYFRLPLLAIGRMMVRNYATASQRLRAIIILVHETDALMASLRGNVTDASREHVQQALAWSARLLDLLRSELPQWSQPAAGVDMRLSNGIRTALPDTIKAAEESTAWLKQEILPKAAPVSVLGAERLRRKLMVEELVDVPLESLLEVAEAALERDSREFLGFAATLAPNQPPPAALRQMSASVVSPTQWIAAARNSAGRLRDFIQARSLLDVPETLKVNVVAAPQFLQGPFEPYHVSLPPALGADPPDGELLLAPPPPSWPEALRKEHLERFTPEEIDLLAAHALIPGLYLHRLHAARYPTRAGKLLESRARAEGWALYVEQMLAEEGFRGSHPRFRLAQLRRALVQDCRLVAALRLHSGQMTLDEAANLFAAKAFLGPFSARQEASRVAVDPGCLCPALGKLILLKLRHDWRQAQGAAFSLRRFHHEFLRHGALPLPLVRRAMLPGDTAPLL